MSSTLSSEQRAEWTAKNTALSFAVHGPDEDGVPGLPVLRVYDGVTPFRHPARLRARPVGGELGGRRVGPVGGGWQARMDSLAVYHADQGYEAGQVQYTVLRQMA